MTTSLFGWLLDLVQIVNCFRALAGFRLVSSLCELKKETRRLRGGRNARSGLGGKYELSGFRVARRGLLVHRANQVVHYVGRP